MAVPELWILGGLIIVAWIAQLVLSYRQALDFSHRIADMRRNGTVAVDRGRGRLRSRVYAIISVGGDDRVVAAEALRGLTSLSAAKRLPGLTGLPYERLCENPVVADFDRPMREALCQAVATIREDRASRRTGEGGAPIAQQA